MSTTVEIADPQAGLGVTPAPWPTIAVTDLLAHSGNVREVEPSAELLDSITAQGITEPLYIVRTSGDAPQVIDGFQRLTAAVYLGLEAVPYTPRPVVRIDALTPHPKNIREDLDITDEFVQSLAEFGCKDVIKIQRLDGGVIQINDGNRRYFASPAAGLTHLPYEWDEDQDEAGQILGMITTAQHRKGLSPSETMAAMFTAAEAGAEVKKIATAAGVRQKDVKAVVASRTDAALKKSLESSSYAWTFDQLAAMGEFADDPAALEAITEAAGGFRADDDDIEWAITLQQTKRDKRMQAEAHRAELEASGQQIRVMAELSDRATPVWRLRTAEGERITAEEHANCKGQVWVLEGSGDSQLKPYCAAPGLYGHAEPGASEGKATNGAEEEAEKAARAAVKLGNLHWDAAETRRRQWITDLIKRRTLPKETANALAGHITTALVDGTWDVGGSLNSGATSEILSGLLGLTKGSQSRSSYTEHVSKDPRRATQLQFAAIAAVRERGAGRYAWRTDDMRCPDIRQPTGRWFAILEALGYSLTGVERAVMENAVYDPNARQAITAGEPEPAEGDEADEDEPDDEPAEDQADDEVDAV